MKYTEELVKKIGSKLDLTPEDVNNYIDILDSNWFDSSNILRSTKVIMLERIKIPAAVALLILNEAGKEAEQTTPKKKPHTQAFSNSGLSSTNFEVQKFKKLVALFQDDEEDSKKEKKNPIEDYLNEFVEWQTNPTKRATSLKKLKFIVGKIINSPDVMSFRTLNTKDPELFRLLFTYVSLSNLLTYLGFELNQEEQLVLDYNNENAEKLMKCLEYIKKIRSEEGPNDIQPQALSESFVREKIKYWLELMRTRFAKIVQPRVQVFRNDFDGLFEIECLIQVKYKKFFFLSSQRDSLFKKSNEIDNNQNSEPSNSDYHDKLSIVNEKISKLEAQIKDLETKFKEKTAERKLLRDECLGQTAEDTEIKIKAFNQIKAIYSHLEKDTDLDFEPSIDEIIKSEFQEIKKQFEDLGTNFDAGKLSDENLTKDLERLRFYLNKDRISFKITSNYLDTLEIDISSSETIDLLFHIIQLKYNFMPNVFEITLDKNGFDLKSVPSGHYLFDLDIYTVEDVSITFPNIKTEENDPFEFASENDLLEFATEIDNECANYVFNGNSEFI